MLIVLITFNFYYFCLTIKKNLVCFFLSYNIELMKELFKTLAGEKSFFCDNSRFLVKFSFPLVWKSCFSNSWKLPSHMIHQKLRNFTKLHKMYFLNWYHFIFFEIFNCQNPAEIKIHGKRKREYNFSLGIHEIPKGNLACPMWTLFPLGN